MPETAIAEFYESRFDPDGLNGRPWQLSRLSPEAFVSNVQAVLDRRGRWETTGEFRMGGDIHVSIETVSVGENAGSEGRPLPHETTAYRVLAECGTRVSAEYTSLEKALGMLSVFEAFVWALVDETDAWRGLVFHSERPTG